MRNRKVQREVRRRRVLRDEAGTRSASAVRSRNGSGKYQLYVEGAVAEAQPRITDFIPRRKYSLCLWLLLCLIPAALVQALFMWRLTFFRGALLKHTVALRLVGANTLATWFSAMLLMLAAVVAMTIYCVRRHKLDDYRGRYRMWLWVAAFCVICSLDTITGLHRPLQSAMIYLTETNLWGDGAVWWMAVYGFAGLLLLIRVVLDVRRSRGTLFSLTAALATYVAAALFYLRVLKIGPTEVDMMAYVGFLMGAHVLLVYSLLVYARYVCREASGEIVVSASATSFGWFRRRGKADADTKPRKKKRKVVPAEEQAYEDVEEDDFEELERLTDPELSKSEQRNQRKKKRQQQRRAA